MPLITEDDIVTLSYRGLHGDVLLDIVISSYTGLHGDVLLQGIAL